MLYQRELGGASAAEVLRAYDDGAYGEEAEAPRRVRSRRVVAEAVEVDQEAFAYARTLFEGVLAHVEELDELIRHQAEHWRLERMAAVDRNILRLAVFEMRYETDVPKLVVVDEAVELAKRFGSEQSGRFVNGLLDGLLKLHTFPGSLT